MTSGAPTPAQATEHARLHDAIALCATPLILIAIYVVSGPSTLPDADAGEFAAVAVAGGIPHPPGYPLLMVILQAFARLSALIGLIPALVLPSTLAATAAAVLLCRTLLDRAQPAFEAAVATLAIFLSCNVWRAATTIEPFALNLLQAALLLWACNKLLLAPSTRDPVLPPLLVGASFGLCVCNHHSLVTLAPLVLAVLWPQRQLWRARALWMLAGFGLGLTPLLFLLFLRDQGGWLWGVWDPFLPQLLHHLARTEYGSLKVASDTNGTWLDGPARMLTTLPRVLSVVFFACLAFGCFVAARAGLRAQSRPGRDAFAIGLLPSFVLSGLCFPALFLLKDDPLANVIVDRFLSLPMLLLAFPIATGLATIRWPLAKLRYVGGAALIAFHVSQQWDSAERASHRIFEDHVHNVVRLAARNAVVMSVSDAGFSGSLYAKYVLGRADMVTITSGLAYPWYRDRIAHELGFAFQAPGTGAGSAVSPPARPLYLLEVPDAEARLSAYPVGSLLRVVDANTRMPSARRQFEDNAAVFATLALPSRDQVLHADAWEASVLYEYYANWDLIGRRLQQTGDARAAQKAFQYRDLFRH